MKFGPVPVDTAEGAILAHAVQAGKARLKKGLRLDAESISQLVASGIEQVIVARLEAGDTDENEAAAALSHAFNGTGIEARPPATGRVNLHAAHDGYFRADKALVDAFNAIDPAITFACLNDRSVVRAGDMVATIKIIPLAVVGGSLSAACQLIGEAGFCAVKPFRPMRVAMLATCLPTLKATVMEKTRDITRSRLSVFGAELAGYGETPHNTAKLAEALGPMVQDHDMVIIFGASAVTDEADIIPAAIRMAGGHVERVGMPVDPGNLMVLGEIGGKPVIGAPGCARSPRDNGFDWVLARLMAGEKPGSDDIARLGVGGLLMEIASRPQPRVTSQIAKGVGIMLLAAGRASRMGEGAGHKLLARFEGEPLIRVMAARALASKAEKTVLVTGHRAADMTAAVSGLDIDVAENANHASGMASSLQTGLAALGAGEGLSGIMILLADMPGLTTAHLDQLIAAFEKADGAAIIRASDGAHRGNPVILPAALFEDLKRLEGDIGARALVESSGLPVIDIDIGAAARIDVDTPEAVRAAGGVTESS